jgi:hypothetical protein
MSLRETRVPAEGTVHTPPGYIAGVRALDGAGEGTVYEVETGTTYAEQSYESGSCKFIEGPLTSVAGATVWIDI